MILRRRSLGQRVPRPLQPPRQHIAGKGRAGRLEQQVKLPHRDAERLRRVGRGESLHARLFSMNARAACNRPVRLTQSTDALRPYLASFLEACSRVESGSNAAPILATEEEAERISAKWYWGACFGSRGPSGSPEAPSCLRPVPEGRWCRRAMRRLQIAARLDRLPVTPLHWAILVVCALRAAVRRGRSGVEQCAVGGLLGPAASGHAVATVAAAGLGVHRRRDRSAAARLARRPQRPAAGARRSRCWC